MTSGAVEWSFVPWRDRPAVTRRAVVAAGTSILVVAALPESLLLRAVLGTVVALSFAAFCLPRHCRLGPEGATVRTFGGTVRREWGEIRRAALMPGGVELSPFAAAHWLDPFRRMQLPFPGRARGRDGVADGVRHLLAEHGL